MLFSYLSWLSCQPFPAAINDDRSFITLWEYKYISITVFYIFPTPQIVNLEAYMLSWKKDIYLYLLSVTERQMKHMQVQN